MEQTTPRLVDATTGKFLLAASTLTVIINAVIILFFGTYHDLIFGATQCIWTVIGIYLLSRIYYSTSDETLKTVTSFFCIALIPWAITLTLWKILLPTFFYNELAYLLTGFGFFSSYCILAYGLLKIAGSKRWYLKTSVNSFINNLWALTVAGICIFVILNLKWDSNRLVDIVTLLLYLIADLTILALCLKLAYRNLGTEVKYVVIVIATFIGTNLIGDLLFELRWLLPVKYIFFYKISFVTNVVYNLSLVFMVLALLIYVSGNRNRALDKINATLSNTRIFIDDFISNSPDAMCIYDANGNAMMVNDQFLRLFQLEKLEIIGKLNLFGQLENIDPDSRPVIARLKNGETVIIPQVKYTRSTEHDRLQYLTVKAYPTFDVGGAISCYTAIFDDVTKKIETEQALQVSKAEAELYLDLMGHDINNMHQIALGYLELARDANENGGELLDKPIEVLHRGTRLIQNVRKLQKLKEGTIVAQHIDVCGVLHDVHREFGAVPGKSVTLDLNGCERCLVRSNEFLYDVFANLASNAIKHTGDHADISIEMVLKEESGGRLCRVSVEDNGPGIPDSIKDRIFNRMQRGDTRAKGMGLGLYLVKTLVDSYGGRVWVEDRVKGDHTQGSKFVVILSVVE